ncbi:MAG: zinc transport system permease protein [Rickettsiales bacterium]|jgi:zinc transport system permease protein
MFEPLFIKALIAGIGVAIALAPIGVFVLWKKMAYFSDAISHSAIFGLAIATIIAVSPMYGIVLCAVIFCFLMFIIGKQNLYSIDSIIGITSATLLSIGMILLAFFPSEIELEEYLFGDLLNLENYQITIIYAAAALVVLAISLWFKKLLLSTINPDLAKISGIKTENLELKFLLLTAIIVACLVKIVGIFLITSMMILPAAIGRNFSKTPTHMIFLSLAFAIFSIVGGLFFAVFFNLPSSPAIIGFSALILILSILSKKFLPNQ